MPDGSPGKVPKNLYRLLNLNYLKYTNLTRAAGIHDLPAINCSTSVLPDYIALYNHPADYRRTPLTAVAFFNYDDTFDGQHGLYNAIYYDNAKDLAKFRRRFEGVRLFIMPDMTQAGDVDDLENHYRLKKMRIVALWLTMELGAVVIPFITFPTLRSIDFALDGYEECGVVAFSTKGYVANPLESQVLREAVRRTVDKLPRLSDIVVYDVCAQDGKAMDLFLYATEHGIRVHVPDNMLKARNRERKGVGHAQL